MTDRELFKIGFLRKCAEEGLTAEETGARVKAALAAVTGVTKVAFDPFGAGAKMLSTGMSYAVPLGALGLAGLAAAPIAAGAGVGYLGAKMQQDPMTVERAKSDEVVAEYLRLADQARRRTELKHALGHSTLASLPPAG